MLLTKYGLYINLLNNISVFLRTLQIIVIAFLIHFSSSAINDQFNQALKFFDQKQYSLAQSIFKNIEGETALFYNAKCSKELGLNDAEELFLKIIDEYPFSLHFDESFSLLSEIYINKENYNATIDAIKKISELNNKQKFNLAYSYFQIDSLETSRYHFSSLLSVDSDYQSASKYYFAHISYKLKNYQTSLKWFRDLRNDKKFKNIVPYYIAQIYYFLEEYDELIEYLLPILDQVIETRKTEVNRLLGGAFYRTKNYLNAVEYLKKYILNSKQISDLEYFMLGFSYYQISDYLLAVENFNKITISENRLSQLTFYYLGASYLRLNKNTYALQSFKNSSKMSFDKKINEEALFNYAKLAYELDLPFENALSVFNDFSSSNSSSDKKDHIKSLTVSLLKGTSNYIQAYDALNEKSVLSNDEKLMFQEITFFIGVQKFNKKNFESAILFFNKSIKSSVNERILSATKVWLADAFYQIGDYENAKQIYDNQTAIYDSYLTNINLYNKGYNLFKLKEYHNSAKIFRKFISSSSDSMFLNDALIRTADSYFMIKDFVLAEDYYDKSIKLNLFDVDYCQFQRAVCMGILGNNSEKTYLLNSLVSNYKNSIYYDDALFGIAEIKKNQNLYLDAISYYDSVISNTSDENLKAKSSLAKAMIFFNDDKTENAIKQYKLVIDEFQNGLYFKEALLGLKSIYVSIAKVDEYISYVNSIPKYKISKSEQDSLSYSAAFIKFSEQDYHTSKNALIKYIDNFREGIFLDEAYNYLAYSHLYTGDSTQATVCFSYIVDNNVTTYLENALIYLARVNFKNQNYLVSNLHYSQLENIASNNSLKREACIRLMYGHEQENQSIASAYAQKVLSLEKIDDWIISKAKIIISRNDFNLGNYNKAKKLFEEIIELDVNSEGAEAMYNIIYLTYLDDSLDLAEKLIFDMPGQFSDDYFIAKSFILLSDIYFSQGNKFQAKATLESIIDNYSGEDLIIIAKQKREKIIESEIVVEKNEVENYYMDIFEDDLDYELQTDIIQTDE